MEVRMGEGKAFCSCGSSDFHPPHKAPFKAGDVFACSRCGRAQSYGALRDAIVEDAIARARRTLESARKELLRCRK